MEDLAQAKLWTSEQKLEAAQMRGQDERTAPMKVKTNDNRQDVDSINPDIQSAEEGFKGSAQAGVENAMDVLDDEDIFDVKTG